MAAFQLKLEPSYWFKRQREKQRWFLRDQVGCVARVGVGIILLGLKSFPNLITINVAFRFDARSEHPVFILSPFERSCGVMSRQSRLVTNFAIRYYDSSEGFVLFAERAALLL